MQSVKKKSLFSLNLKKKICAKLNVLLNVDIIDYDMTNMVR